MAVCQDVRTFFTSEVLVPVTQFITEARQVCEEVRERIEEAVSQPVEQWISQQEERCRELPWWNPVRWFCEIVTVVVKVVVWVVVTVVKWVVTLVCQIVTVVIGIIVTFVLRVIAWVVTFIVCIFTDPLEALISLRDLWMIIVETVADVIEFVDLLLEDVLGILEDIEDLLDSLASSLGWLGVVLAAVRGLISLIKDWVSIIRDFVRAVADIILGILSLNLCRVLRGVADAGTSLGRALMATGLVVLLPVKVVGAIAGGVRDGINQIQLEQIIRDTINNAFGAGSPRASRSIARTGLNVRPMGLPFRADARRLFLRSNSRSVDLRALHNAGTINLYALAGKFSDCSTVFNQPDGEVVYAGTDLNVSYADLATFLRDGAGSVPEFHVYPITRAKFREHLTTVDRKAEMLGVRLFYRTIGELEATSLDHIPLNVGLANPPSDTVQQDLFGRMGRNGVNDDLSIVPSLSIFHYVLDANGRELFGIASWWRPSINSAGRSGVSYRNRSPDWGLRFVLTHEIGHYWGLDHTDRDGNERGLEQIMYSPRSGVNITGWTVLEYGLLGTEPRFTIDDARTAWEWITTDGAASLLP